MSEYITKCSEGVGINGNRFVIPDYLDTSKEIVRCRYCKHHEYLRVSYSDKPLSVCTSEQWIGAEGDEPLVKPDGFCAWGERKEQ